MNAVGIYEAKTQLSRLVALAEEGTETVITRHGRPVARIAPTEEPAKRKVIFGAWAGLVIPDDWDEYTEEDDKLWYEGSIVPGDPAMEAAFCTPEWNASHPA